MKYTFTLVQNGWEREKRILESGPGESTRHISLKIVAYLLYRGEAAPLPLQIERRVGQRHKPDLVAMESETEFVRLWIDCGQIETERLGRIAEKNPHTRIVVVKSTEYEARLYAKAALRDLPEEKSRRAQIGFVGFDSGFISRFAEALRGANSLSLEQSDSPDTNLATFVLNEQVFSTGIYRLPAGGLDKIS